MQEVNYKLIEHKKWEQLFDAAIIVQVPDSKIVFEWRELAEQPRRLSVKGALS